MRVEAAASAKCARSAPWVMLPASTTWRNRLRSARSKRKRLPSYLTKPDYAECQLRLGISMLIFRVRRSDPPREVRDKCLWLRCGMRADWIGRLASLARRRRANSDEHDGRNQGPRRAAAIAAPANLPADADDDDVDRSSHHRNRPVLRHRAAGVVVHRRRGPERLRPF